MREKKYVCPWGRLVFLKEVWDFEGSVYGAVYPYSME